MNVTLAVVILVVLGVALAVFLVNVRRHHPENTATHREGPHRTSDRPADAGAEAAGVVGEGEISPADPTGLQAGAGTDRDRRPPR